MPKPGDTIHRYITLDATHCERGDGPRLYVSGDEQLSVEEVGRLYAALGGWLRTVAPCPSCDTTGRLRSGVPTDRRSFTCGECGGHGHLAPPFP